MSVRRLALLVLAAALQGAALAAEPVVVRTALEPENSWVGQRTTLRIEVLARDGWGQLAGVPDLDIDGALAMRLESQGVRINQTIDGDAYTGQRYSILLYPQRAGTITVPPVELDVVVRAWGVNAAEQSSRHTTTAQSFEARMPPGAGQMHGLLSSTRISATQSFDREPLDAAVGDAIVRTISLEGADIAGLAFAPLEHPAVDGVAVYPGEPAVDNRFARGSLTGARTETFTYVFEQPGTANIPAFQIHWWDTRSESLRTIDLPGLSPSVTGVASAAAPQEPTAVPATGSRRWIALLLLAIVAIVAGLAYRPAAIRVAAILDARRNSEGAAFRHALKAMRQGERRDALRATMHWLDRLDDEPPPARLDRFLERHGESQDRAIAAMLGEFDSPLTADDRRAMATSLRRARTRCLQVRRRKSAAAVLPELNPTRH